MSDQSTPIIVFGAAGRMGSRLCALAGGDSSTRLIAAIVREQSPRIGQLVRDARDGQQRFISPQKAREIPRFPRGVVIDFSGAGGTADALALALHRSDALLVGSTGLAPEALTSLREASSSIPVLISPNTSMGVAVVAAIASSAVRMLGAGFDCSIVESHHAAKRDAPSGTARRLAEALRGAGAHLPEQQVVAIRGGDVIGEHTVRLAGAGEYIEITHRATSRDVFVHGALRAARWLAGREAGAYTIEDALNLAT